MGRTKARPKVRLWSDMPFPRIGDEPWQRDAVARIIEAYGPKPRQGLCSTVRSSLFAADYCNQAPVIAACDPVRLGKAIARGGRLKEVMARLGLAYPLRRLQARSCAYGSEKLFKAVSEFHHSLVSQAIPHNADLHRTWVAGLRDWCATMKRRDRLETLHLEWAVVHAGMAAENGQSLQDVADMAAALGNRFNPAWSFDRAVRASTEWHRELAKTNGAERQYRQLGVGFDEPIDYGDLPVEHAVGRFVFVALRSGERLHEDGRVMRHCVASYGPDVIKGRCRIYSVRQDATPLATLEIRPSRACWSLVQIKGPCNARPNESVLNAAILFVAGLPKPKGLTGGLVQHDATPEVRA